LKSQKRQTGVVICEESDKILKVLDQLLSKNGGYETVLPVNGQISEANVFLEYCM
jgi:hypothetical protein